jgi:NADH-quinone oxidoreductase subunit A
MQNSVLNGVDNYLPVFVFLCVAGAIACIVVILPFICAVFRPTNAKVAAYECGFEPFGDARGKFDIRFYLVAILFIIFDLEIALLIPWAASAKILGSGAFYSVMFFLFVLTVGFVYEWRKGALKW